MGDNDTNCLGISCPVNSQSLLVLDGSPGVIDLARSHFKKAVGH